MKDHFEEWTVFHLEKEEDVPEKITIYDELGEKHNYDKVNFTIIEHSMFAIGQIAGDDEYIPADIYPLHAISRVENHFS